MLLMLNKKTKEFGFTLVELIIVLSIISLLMFLCFYFYQDLTKRARDATRLSDLANLEQAIMLSLQNSDDTIGYTLCSRNVTPCAGTSFPEENTTQKTNGSGWLKVNLDQYKTANFKFLPIDPINNLKFHYAYYSDGLFWKISSKLESQKYKSKMNEDGGNDPEAYEIVVTVAKPKLSF